MWIYFYDKASVYARVKNGRDVGRILHGRKEVEEGQWRFRKNVENTILWVFIISGIIPIFASESKNSHKII